MPKKKKKKKLYLGKSVIVGILPSDIALYEHKTAPLLRK